MKGHGGLSVRGSWLVPVLLMALVGLIPLLIFSGLLVAIYSSPVKWEPPNLWSTRFGASASGPDVGNEVTSLSADAGGLYAAGYVGWILGPSVNATPSELFVSRYDLSHRQVWYESFGNPEGSQITGMGGSADGVYVTANLEGISLLEKYAVTGSLSWTVNLTDSQSLRAYPSSLSVGASGVYVIGSNLLSNYTLVVTLRAFDFQGGPMWTMADDFGGRTVVAASNGLYVFGYSSSGSFVRRYDFNGGLIWNSLISCGCSPSEVSTDGTNLYVAGESGNLVSAFVAKYDSDGGQAWIRQFRPPQTGVYRVWTSAASSGVYLGLETNQGYYLFKYDVNGNSVWSFGIPLCPVSISIGGDNVYVGGGSSCGYPSTGRAAISEFSQSSSLIFFGLNPPFSFLAVSLLIAAATMSILWLRKRANTRARNPPQRVNR